MKKYQEVINLINDSRYILILTHINPDADTISCGLALSNYCFENKIKHKVYNSSKEIPNSLDFLPRFDKITSEVPKFYDLVIYVDCADELRVGLDLALDTKVISIDHHQSNTNFANINIVDDSKASTAEVLYDIFEYNSIKISKNIASCLYVGIYDDSIAFTTPRTTSRTYEVVNTLVNTGISPSEIANKLLRRDSLARYRIMPKILSTLQLSSEGRLATVYLENSWIDETGAKISECDDIVNMVLNIAVVEVIAYLRVKEGKVRVSLRSKGDIDVSKIAKNLNGGGHKNAAGLSIDTKDILEAKDSLISLIQNYI
ncbi:MAG: bifunctional oligoribonuclease/PAP phosphatase NrnA [Campylobacterota bacterium]|nr:bifunctional oligoribonuclease/PAP phosphatase NrnA [Campylobacterota bacterium]